MSEYKYIIDNETHHHKQEESKKDKKEKKKGGKKEGQSNQCTIAINQHGAIIIRDLEQYPNLSKLYKA